MGKMGQEKDFILRKTALDDIDRLSIDTVDCLGRPVPGEDIKVSVLGTILCTEKADVIPVDFLKDLITEYEAGTNCEKMWATGLTCAIQKWKAQEKRCLLQ